MDEYLSPLKGLGKITEICYDGADYAFATEGDVARFLRTYGLKFQETTGDKIELGTKVLEKIHATQSDMDFVFSSSGLRKAISNFTGSLTMSVIAAHGDDSEVRFLVIEGKTKGNTELVSILIANKTETRRQPHTYVCYACANVWQVLKRESACPCCGARSPVRRFGERKKQSLSISDLVTESWMKSRFGVDGSFEPAIIETSAPVASGFTKSENVLRILRDFSWIEREYIDSGLRLLDLVFVRTMNMTAAEVSERYWTVLGEYVRGGILKPDIRYKEGELRPLHASPLLNQRDIIFWENIRVETSLKKET